MATPPNPPLKSPSSRPEAASSRPNPLHGAPPAAPLTGAHVAADTVPPNPPQMRVNIHGIPPAPNMAPPPNVNEDIVNEATELEMTAGKEALDTYAKRTEAEFAYGKKAISRYQREVTPVSKE